MSGVFEFPIDGCARATHESEGVTEFSTTLRISLIGRNAPYRFCYPLSQNSLQVLRQLRPSPSPTQVSLEYASFRTIKL